LMSVAFFLGCDPLREDLCNGICDEGRSLSPPLSEAEHDGKENPG
jgi:hypothetical protein